MRETAETIPTWKAHKGSSATVSHALIDMLGQLGVRHAFGILGGANVFFARTLAESPIEFLHCRHESGAAFAATEASLATGQPTVVFTTAGPGIANAINGMIAARVEGAHVVMVSAATIPANRGRYATQETSSATLPSEIFDSGRIFNFGTIIEGPSQLAQAFPRLALGFQDPCGYLAHISLPTQVQSMDWARNITFAPMPCRGGRVIPAEETVAEVYQLLKQDPFVIWAGYGARHAAKSIRRLARASGAPVMCTPRAKGVFPENDPLFLGGTGLAGHQEVVAYLEHNRPRYILVLGTRLGEASTFFSPDYTPEEAFIHVDLRSEVMGVAYPEVHTIGIRSDIKAFVDNLVWHWPTDFAPAKNCRAKKPAVPWTPRKKTPVRPQMLMSAIQKVIVEDSDAIVAAESGTSFAWATHYLRFKQPGRYRISTHFGSMAHMACGVFGIAHATKKKAVALVGDCSLMMMNEINTAVALQAPAVWIVMNDAAYGMCVQGMKSAGWKPLYMDVPRVDFVKFAESLGARGIRVERETDLASALGKALDARGPFIVDVDIDLNEQVPAVGRFKNLSRQGADGPKG